MRSFGSALVAPSWSPAQARPARAWLHRAAAPQDAETSYTDVLGRERILRRELDLAPQAQRSGTAVKPPWHAARPRPDDGRRL